MATEIDLGRVVLETQRSEERVRELASELEHLGMSADEARAKALNLERQERRTADETGRWSQASNELFEVEGNLGQALRVLGPEVAAVGGYIAAAAAGAVAAAAAIGALGVAIAELAARGRDVDRIATPFERLSSPQLLSRLRAATGGLVSDTGLMQEAIESLRSSAAPTEDEVVNAFEAISRTAQASGEEVTEALDSVSDQIDEGTVPSLALLGERSDSSAEAMTRLEVSAGNALDRLSRGVAQSDGLTGSLDGLNSALTALGTNWESVGYGIGEVGGMMVRGIATAVSGAASAIQSALNTAALALRALGAEETAQDLLNAAASIGEVARAGAVVSESGGAPPPPPPPVEGAPDLIVTEAQAFGSLSQFESRRRGGGGAARTESQAEMTSLTEARIQAEERLAAAIRARKDADYEASQEMAAEAARASQAGIDSIRSLDNYRQASFEAESERIRELQELEEKRVDRVGDVVGEFQAYAGAVASVGTTIGGVFGELASREEAGSEAAKKYGAIQGGIMAGMAYVQAAIQIADAIKYGTAQSYGQMAGAIAASIAYIAAGTLALTNLGGHAQAPSGAGGGHRVTAPAEPARAEEGGGGTTVQIWAVGWGSGGLAREMERTSRQAQRYGADRAMIGAGRWVG